MARNAGSIGNPPAHETPILTLDFKLSVVTGTWHSLLSFFYSRRQQVLKRLSFPFIVILALALLPQSGLALPKFWTLLNHHYKFAPGSDAANAKCRNCHVPSGPPDRNAFGKAVEDQINNSPGGDLTDQMLINLEPKDSDGDGYNNGDELKAGFNPGDPKSHPSPLAKAGSVAPDPATPSQTSGSAPANPWLPSHFYHPSLVHFPIALFLFGAVFDFVGWRRKNATLRTVGLYNISFGAIATAIAVPTGFLAAWRMGFSLAVGNPGFIHVSLALTSTLLMSFVSIWRAKSLPTSSWYWGLLLLAAIGVGAAGHFGGNLALGT